jgi:hypothetical protein
MRILKHLTVLVGVGIVAVMIASPAFSADWELNPSVEGGYLIDDNYRLSSLPGSEIEVSGPMVDAELELRALMPTSEFSFTPRVRGTYFADESEVDSIDYYATLDWNHTGQRGRSSIRGEFAQQDVVSSEQPDAEVDSGLGEPVMGDAGRVLVNNRRLRAFVRPAFDFELSERRAMRIEASFADVSFDEEISEAQVDYQTAELAAGLTSRLSELRSLTTRVKAAQYDIETQDTTTSYGAEVQWDTRRATGSRSFLRAGLQSVEVPSGDNEVAWLAGAGTSFIRGRNEIFTDVSRSVGPSSAGLVISRDQLRVRWTYAMTPRLNLLAGLRGMHDDAVDEASTFTERNYATGDVGLQWRWQEELSLRFAYDYTWQEFRDAVDDATSSGAMVSVIYQPTQRRPSRNN